MTSAPGFVLEEVYRAPRDDEGSWVSLAVESDGVLLAASENGTIYRVHLPASPGERPRVEPLDVEIGQAQGMLRAFDSLYVMRNDGVISADAKNGLYRLRDRDGDGSYEEVTHLRALEGFGEHGPHQLVMSPDGEALYALAGNATKPTDFASSRVAAAPREDQLLTVLPCWDRIDHDPPGGWIARVDPDGENWELIAAGTRNAYDLAFDRNGELFVFDADMEWDIGAPWYRPTRVLHVVSGGEYGWRRGSAKWQNWFPDNLPAVVDIGTASPTGVVFGSETHFPGKFRNALFLADWSHGRVYAVHLTPEGASYTAEAEIVASGEPLPVTDIVANPSDGALYLTTGGRGVQTVLYRLRHTAPEPRADPAIAESTPAAKRRRSLERFHTPDAEQLDAEVWNALGDDDRHVRYAARVALEHAPPVSWRGRALLLEPPIARLEALVALARVGDLHDRDPALAALLDLDPQQMPATERRRWLRAVHLWLARHGRPNATIERNMEAKIERFYPSSDFAANRVAGEILVFLESPVGRTGTLDLLARSPTQEEQIHYAYVLSHARDGWTDEERGRYLAWFDGADALPGGNCLSTYVEAIEDQATVDVSWFERSRITSDATVDEILPQGPGRTWTVAEAFAAVAHPVQDRDFEQGRAMFAATGCWNCHRFDGRGGSLGPDLSNVGGRLGTEDLLRAIIEPSAFVSSQYATTEIELDDGSVIHGQIFNTVPGWVPVYGGALQVRTDFQASEPEMIAAGDVVEIRSSTTSMMPSRLVDPLSAEELQDLLGYLLSGGDPAHPAF